MTCIYVGSDVAALSVLVAVVAVMLGQVSVDLSQYAVDIAKLVGGGQRPACCRTWTSFGLHVHVFGAVCAAHVQCVHV